MRQIVFALFAASLWCSAQTITSSIVGTVTDPSGAVIPRVDITVRSLDTGIRSTTITDGVGNYTVGQLPPGNYEVSAEIAGFKKFMRQNVSLEMARQLRIDIRLETGSATETIKRGGHDAAD